MDHIASTAQHGGAAVTAISFFSMQWWNDNSAGIVAICAALGLLVSVAGFIAGHINRKRQQVKGTKK